MQTLNFLANNFNLAVIVTNQVTAVPKDGEDINDKFSLSNFKKVRWRSGDFYFINFQLSIVLTLFLDNSQITFIV